MQTKQQKTTNQELRDRVERQLDWEPAVTSTDIGVTADDEIVTLTGYVESYSAKLAAEKAALGTFGVKGVANDINVKPFTKITDSDITATAVAALESRIDVPSKQIKIIVKDSLVYLQGTVDWKYQKDAAENAVSHLYGTTGVINKIEIVSPILTTGVKDKIEAAFLRSAELDARRLTVTAHDGTVELWGNVRTWSEKFRAEQAAWSAPGVTKVESHVHITP